MISGTQLDALKKLHKDHIANTFLFTNKVLDQRRRISEAQAEAMHGLLQDLAGMVSEQVGEDPAQVAHNALRRISEAWAGQSARSTEFFGETTGAYAEILRLVMGYSADTFVSMQTAGRQVGQINASTTAVGNPWMESFIDSFENAAELMDTSLKPGMKAAETSARAVGGNGRAGAAGKARH